MCQGIGGRVLQQGLEGYFVSGKVILTDSISYEISTIRALSEGHVRKFYVYGSGSSVDVIKEAFPDFVFIEQKKIRHPESHDLFVGNTSDDFIVLKRLRFCRIMDRDIDMLQTVVKGYKAVVDDHPFMGRSEIYWSYFPWSFFDKSLLGYPHCYAFQRARVHDGQDPFDCKMLAQKVSKATQSTLDCIFKDDIEIQRVSMDDESKVLYQDLKKRLFGEETSPKVIIRRLKGFVQDRFPQLSEGLDILNLSKVHDQYRSGIRVLKLSDSKVDVHLESEFWKYIFAVNLFVGSL